MNKVKIDIKHAELAGHWFKALAAGNERSKSWCVARKIGLEKASGEVPDSAGGFLVPETVSAEILRIVEQVGAFRRGAQIHPVTSDADVSPRRVNGVVASFVSEGQVIPESSFLLDGVEVTLRKAAMLVRSSAELFEDSAADLGAFLITEFAYALAALEDDCGFNGDGTSAYRGISGLSTRLAGMRGSVQAASGHGTFLTLDTTDIANLMAGVMGAAIPGAAFYVSALGYAQTFSRLSAVAGGLFVDEDGSIIAATYLGFPIHFSAKLPNVSTTLTGLPMVFFGDLRMSSLLAQRHEMVVAISRQRALENDQILVRCTKRLDIVNHSCGTATAAGPVACLLGG
jgi:HK97 family phage major capsid protein